jgi:hypothetical protein
MEKKLTRSEVFISLLINSLKSKRNWFLLSAVIILVSTLLIPYILKIGEEVFILFGIVETFFIVFINCLVDNSFLHSDNKLAYYKSKPVPLKDQMVINIIINVVLAAFLLALTAVSIAAIKTDHELFYAYKLAVPWILAGIFIASLSSVLSGNTLMAGAMTIFNFALPAIIFLIIYFIFTILENIVAGFSADVLMDYFLNSVYRIEYLYFFEYVENNKPVDLVYILILAVILIIVGILILRCIKKRKNENTGNFIAFDGYKYFVSVIASLILPSAFAVSSYGQSIWGKIAVCAVIAGLSYYIINAVMEKSFKISALSIKVFAASMAMFAVMTGGTVAVANQYRDVVPDPDDVRMAYIGNMRGAYNSLNQGDDISEDDIINMQKNMGTVIFEDIQNITSITDLHRDLITDQSYNSSEYYYRQNVVISYLMKDGSIMTRDYKIKTAQDASKSETKDNLAHRLISSEEMKRRKYYFLYDEGYSNKNNLYVYVGNDGSGQIAADNIDIDEIRQYLINDTDKQYNELSNSFSVLLFYNYDMPNIDAKEAYYKESRESRYYLEVVERDVSTEETKDKRDKHLITIYFNNGFDETFKYLEPRINKSQN